MNLPPRRRVAGPYRRSAEGRCPGWALRILLSGSLGLGACELPSSGSPGSSSGSGGYRDTAAESTGSRPEASPTTSGGSTGGGSDVGRGTPSGAGGSAGEGGASAGEAPEASIAGDMEAQGEQPPSRSLGALCGSGDGCSPGVPPSGCAPPTTEELGSPTTTLDCKLRVEEASSIARTSCSTAGPRQGGESCQEATDCAAGLGCVREPGGARCRAYCCGDPEACEPGTFCRPAPSAEDRDTKIPACVPAEPCTLLEDETCCDAGSCERTCTLVRRDGTTSCVTPGQGRTGEACPCQAGYLCAQLTGRCMQLCLLGEPDPGCEGGGACQAGIEGLPAGVGLCSTGEQRLASP
jgi:hypothetical protein